jgi:hypothetical protein
VGLKNTYTYCKLAAPAVSEYCSVKVWLASDSALGVTETAVAFPNGALMVRPNVAVRPEYMAVSVTGVEAATLPAVTVKAAEVAPDTTVTDAGTVAAEVFELESVTRAPPMGAAAVKVTVPVPDWPLTIVLGDTETLLSVGEGGLTVRPNVVVTPE